MSNRLKKIIENDGHNCHLCGYPVVSQEPGDTKREQKRNRQLVPTVDHVVPRSKKGSYRGLANLRLAHKWCNSVRGNLDLTDELKLAIQEGFEMKFFDCKKKGEVARFLQLIYPAFANVSETSRLVFSALTHELSETEPQAGDDARAN